MTRGHNIRDERYTDRQEHIDKTLSEQNVTVRDVPVRQAYEDIFVQSVEEYNAKQKRSDRHITDYYDKIKHDKRKHLVYECIVQIGDRSDTGNSAELERQALQRFAEEWENRNPNLKLIGAYIHCDEPDGTVHMHLDYIPVAECTRGMRLQNSLDRALQQQGFHSENIHKTAQIAWQDSEREALCVICRDLGIDVQRNQGIGKDRQYLTPQEYRRAKKEQQSKIMEELKPLKEKLDQYRELDVSAKDFDVKKKNLLGKKVSVAVEDMSKLEEQAAAYRVNRKEIKSLRKEKIRLDKYEKAVYNRETQINERSDQLEREREELEKERQRVQQMYERQKNVNQLLEQSESRVSSLIAENNFLSYSEQQQAKVIQELQEELEVTKEQKKKGYDFLTRVVQAVGLLAYGNERGGYRTNLTEKQRDLVDAIANYGECKAKWAGYYELAEKMKSEVGISPGMQQEIDEIEESHNPKKSRDRGLSLD